jgi:hypothetical protein
MLRSWQRLALVATALLIAPATPHVRSVHAGEPTPSAHEAAVLNRIFANWKARHDRVRTLHFTIDSRTVYKKGSRDLSRVEPGARLDRDQLFQQFGAQIWIDGDGRMCVVKTPTFKVPQAKLTETDRVALRWVLVGQTIFIFSASPSFETGVAPPNLFAPNGSVWRNVEMNPALSAPLGRPVLLMFRPQSPWMSLQKSQCRLVDENSLVDGDRYIKFLRVLEASHDVPLRRDESFWVSPARDDAVVHWRIEAKDRTIDGSVKYQKDPTCGWVPSEWTVGTRGAEFSEYKVVKYELNEKINPAVFSQTFPAGTPVQERVGDGAAQKIRHYVVQPDGLERAITLQDYLRLARVP